MYSIAPPKINNKEWTRLVDYNDNHNTGVTYILLKSHAQYNNNMVY